MREDLGSTMPVSEAYISRQMTPTATGATVIGAMIDMRNTRTNFSSRWTRSASARPRTVSITSTIETNRTVVHIESQNVASVKTLM